MEAAILLPERGDFSQLGVKKQGLHFLTAGSKGEHPVMLLLELEAKEELCLRCYVAVVPGIRGLCGRSVGLNSWGMESKAFS